MAKIAKTDHHTAALQRMKPLKCSTTRRWFRDALVVHVRQHNYDINDDFVSIERFNASA